MWVSCDSACWWNFIPCVIKKKLGAASSWSSCLVGMFNTCVAPFSVSPIISRCVASGNFHVLRNFLVGVVVGRFAWCLSANSPIQLYKCPCAHVSTFLPFFPNLVSKYVLFCFQKHLQNKLHIGVIELKCQLWPFEVQYLQRGVGGNYVSYVNRFLCSYGWLISFGTSEDVGRQILPTGWFTRVLVTWCIWNCCDFPGFCVFAYLSIGDISAFGCTIYGLHADFLDILDKLDRYGRHLGSHS